MNPTRSADAAVRTTARRLEIKAVSRCDAEAELRAALALASCGLRRHHPRRVVQSVYLDNPERTAVADNVAGIAVRTKLRWRWYGTDDGAVRGRLERKRRIGALGEKDVVAPPEPLAVRGADRWRFVADLRRLCPPAAHAWFASAPEPAQWIRYHRDYLISADGRMRVTVDTDLRTLDLTAAAVLGATGIFRRHAVVVLEIKIDPADEAAAHALLQQLPAVVDKSSKFVLASAPAEAPRPTGAFHRPYRRFVGPTSAPRH